MTLLPIIVAYFTSWSIYAPSSYFVTNIPANKITHINYAFANITLNGSITLGDSWADVETSFTGDTPTQLIRGNFNQLIKLKKLYPHLRTLISVGGYTWSGQFSNVALTDKSRSTFAASCVQFIQKYSFDGIDLDWEYPVAGGLPTNIYRPADKENYVLLLKEIRRQLDRVSGKKYLLTVAAGAGPTQMANLDLRKMATYLDWINIMTYDYHGDWESKTGHNAPLYKNNKETTTNVAPSFIKSKFNCDATVQGYIAAGVPPHKLNMGIPLYGYGWTGVTSKSLNGFSQPGTPWTDVAFDYDTIKKSYIPSSKRYWDQQSKVPFLFNSSAGTWISYDDLESMKWKNSYIKSHQLAGAMFWEVSNDRQADLISATFKAFNNHPWKPSTKYHVGSVVTYMNKLYRCRQAHTSLPKSKLSITPALWQIIN